MKLDHVMQTATHIKFKLTVIGSSNTHACTHTHTHTHTHLGDFAIAACIGVCLDDDHLMVSETQLVDQFVAVGGVQLERKVIWTGHTTHWASQMTLSRSHDTMEGHMTQWKVT